MTLYLEISTHHVHFCESIVEASGRLERRFEDKTDVKRWFSCPARLQALLQSIKPEQVEPDELVFPSPKGKTMVESNFLHWHSVHQSDLLSSVPPRLVLSFYTRYVEFLFMMGCRASEATALQWKHISRDFRMISFEQAVVDTKRGREVPVGLKTQERRPFPCNEKVQAILQRMQPAGADPETLRMSPVWSGIHLR